MPAIPCVLMRGGTSRGPYFRSEDLPQRSSCCATGCSPSVMGSGHELQIDGIGGGHPLTSKIAIVGPSARPDADVDYLFAQASVLEPVVDTSPNCGNMLAGVGPFAIEAGMVAATAPETRVRIHNVNTGKLIEAIVQTPGGAVTYEGEDGDRRRAGHRGADPPQPSSMRPASKTGRLLPTGQRPRPDPGRGGHLHRHGDAARDPARGRPRQDRARAPGRARCRPRVLRAPGGDPPRGRRHDGARRRRRHGDPQARPGLGRQAGGTLNVRYFTPARLPSRRRGHRCGRHRHGLRHARQPRPGDCRPDAGPGPRH